MKGYERNLLNSMFLYSKSMDGKFDIFISYRRKGGYDTAKLLYDRLRMDSYSVSFDMDTMERGVFGRELEQRINSCRDFLLVLSPGIFDRVIDPESNQEDDWVLREIACALAGKKNVIPLVLENFVFPKNLNLPDNIKDITGINALDLHPKFFEAAYLKLKQGFLLSKPHWATRYKKKIITLFSILFLAFASWLYLEVHEEAIKAAEIAAKNAADSVRTAMTREQDSIKRYLNSKAQRQKTQQQKPQALPQPQETPAAVEKSPGRVLYWKGPDDAISQVILEKIAAVGVKRETCSGNGVNISVNKFVEHTYSPKLTLTDCNGKLLHVLTIDTHFESLDMDAKDLADELRKISFGNWVSFLKNLE